jgi:hypothetical protein
VSSSVCNVYALCSPGSIACVDVAPGRDAQRLGVDFPTFGTVKITYPNSSILINSVGDLLFAVNLTKPGRYRSIDIYVPPDFTGLTISQLWSSFTNNYDPGSISLSRRGTNDQIAPNWWDISIKNIIVIPQSTGPTDVADRKFVASEIHYVRLFQVTSPSIAGRYFFKTFVNGTSTGIPGGGSIGTSSGGSIGAVNFPTVVVKASRDPAYISGTLMDVRNASIAFAQSISIPDGAGARILATGKDYFGRTVSAQTFINSSAKGQYTLFGVAPGTYNITAYAAGYIPTTRPTSVSVLAQQSLVGVDIYMKHSANVTGRVLSICGGQPIAWGTTNQSAIRIQLLTLSGSVVASFPAQFGGIAAKPDPALTFFDFSIQYLGFDGRIPQDTASYTSGLVAGDFLFRASVNSYIQYDDSFVHIRNDTSFVRSEVRLIRMAQFAVTVHFKDFATTLKETPVPSPGGSLTVQAYDERGNVGGRGTASVPAGASTFTVFVPCAPGTYHLFATFAGNLYYQTEDVQASIGLPSGGSLSICGGDVSISFAMLRGGRIELTFYSVDTERPTILKPWTFPNSTISVNIVDSYGNLYAFKSAQGKTVTPQHPNSTVAASFAGFPSDNYTIFVSTYGYNQREIINLHVVQGGTSDASVWLVQAPRVDLTIVFKTEGLLSPIDSTQAFAQPLNHLDSTPVRVEIFDAHGNFVGANRTYVGNNNSSVKVTLVGFKNYYGDPRLTWAGFYDTTDAVQQDDGGLQAGAYLIRIWVNGYCQLQLIPVTLPSAGEVSIIYSMERASRITGTVLGLESEQYPERLSWAAIDLESENFSFNTFSLDGNYSLWVPAGSYNMGVSLPGYATYTARFEVPKGSDLKADIWLDDPRSSTPYVISSWHAAGIWLVVPVFTGLAQNLPGHALSKGNWNGSTDHSKKTLDNQQLILFESEKSSDYVPLHSRNSLRN